MLNASVVGLGVFSGVSLAPHWLEQAAGAFLVLVGLRDVFLTVLYARAGHGVVSSAVGHATWRVLRWLAFRRERSRGRVMSFCGPAIMVAFLAAWTFILVCGAALILQPTLGTVTKSSGEDTPADIAGALYAGGTSLSIVRASSLTPRNGFYRLLFLLFSCSGVSVLSLTLTYLMQVHTALLRRNSLGLRAHLLTLETGDAAEMLARLGPQGHVDAGLAILDDLGAELVSVEESQHFYPLLAYFRFREPHYGVSRIVLLSLDTVTLIRTALSDETYRWLKESGATEQLWRGAMALVTLLETTFIPGDFRPPELAHPPSDPARRRYRLALRRLRRAGFETVSDEEAGAQRYASMRARWERRVLGLGAFMGYRREEVDPAGTLAQRIGRVDP